MILDKNQIGDNGAVKISEGVTTLSYSNISDLWLSFKNNSIGNIGVESVGNAI